MSVPTNRGAIAPGSAPAGGHQDSDLYRVLFERSPDAILVIEGDCFVDCNEATARMLGYPSRAALMDQLRSREDGRLRVHPAEFSPPTQPDGRDSYEKANAMMRIAFEHGSHRFPWDHKRANGEIFPVEVVLVAGHRDGLPLLHVVWREIGERLRLEAELRRAQRLEAIGKLAGGIAHDFNNLLVVIQGHAELLAEKVAGLPELHDHARQILGAGERAGRLTHQLLVFGRRQMLQPRAVDLVELTRGMLPLLESLCGERIALRVELAPEPLPVRADPSQFEQILINLVVNARDAMPDGGEVRLALLRLVRAEGDAALLTVADGGAGMAPEVAERAFDPFFTTKEFGKGTGLGLATVYGIVTHGGGQIAIHSELGRGTELRIQLPLCADTLEKSAVPAAAEPGPRCAAAGTILLVEDERGVRELVERVLSGAGYQVLAAASAEEALARIAGDASAIDLLLTDVVLPRRGGAELAHDLERLRPGLRILFASGFLPDSGVDLDELERRHPVLRKPFTPKELLEAVRARLEA